MASSRAFSCIARAMRKMYLARSAPGSFDQYFSYAVRAALTASSTSRSSASATSASFCSVLGLTVSKYLPLRGARKAPPMNSSCRGAMVTWSVASGEGA